MTTRADIVSAARSLIDTPYRHQGRVPGPLGGTDCIGVPVLVSWACGLRPRDWDVRGYRRLPDGHSLLRRLRAEMGAEVAEASVKPGDLIVLDWGQFPHHVAVVGDYERGGLSMIHADNISASVVEHRMSIGSPGRFVTAFQFAGIEDV